MCLIKVFLFVLLKVSTVYPVQLDVIDCGIDHELDVSEGDVEIKQYPWLGIFFYSFHGADGELRAVTTVALIQAEFVIAPAADIGPIPKSDFRRNSRVLLGQNWGHKSLGVRNYVLHPEYGETLNTVALIQLSTPVRSEYLKPLCPPPERLQNPDFYVVKFKDSEDFNKLQKQVIPVTHVGSTLCRDFYLRANLYAKKMRPPHVACAVALEEDVCVWSAGGALVSRDAWGRWQLVKAYYDIKRFLVPATTIFYGFTMVCWYMCTGSTNDTRTYGVYDAMKEIDGFIPALSKALGLGVRGPGCGAPSRYLDMMSYYPWIEDSLDKFRRISISKISKQKYVLRGSGFAYQRFGNCDEEEKINLIYREMISLRTDNNMYQFLTYNMSLYDNVEFSCLTLELVNASGISEMRIKHACPRESRGPPCYRYKGSVFDITLYIMFSDTARFEMFAWGWKKNMTLIDIHQWKLEEGTYYEDFSMRPVEYRGPMHETEFGFEPLVDSLWLPEYDYWSTTEAPPITTSTTTPAFTTPVPLTGFVFVTEAGQKFVPPDPNMMAVMTGIPNPISRYTIKQTEPSTTTEAEMINIGME